jgi:hypothetical protein
MTEQVTHVGGATVEPDKEVLIQYRESVTGSPQAITNLHSHFSEVVTQHDKRLLDSLNEAYGGEMEPEEKEFLKHAKAYRRRRLSGE